MSSLGTPSHVETSILTLPPTTTATGPTTIYVTSTETSSSTHASTSSIVSDVASSATHTFTSSIATDVASSTSLGATVSSDAPSASDGLGTGAKAGIGVGVSLGILLLGALVAYIILLRRRLRKASRENALPVGPAIPPHGILELGTEGQKYELMGDKAWPEPSAVGTNGRAHAHELES
ncbi:uncharacterized protein NFIA_095140 [Aspergillus fischeri NRRL 181]|uniref:Uncharacterized protein n=1 Tax=Neosartorya fischeri (strain ATCC 1020 / DSM 3700 / CBS 544.65 / FGSC A1164 / JCM 1740 / NRRL 181 / WB 181) TaxID=331117 RepID=A1DAK4_NEOFI|nr:uncharacterized protein NFIA_095140 [Aspergillus fischeri NRRL 181]EAW19894.1 hypothetical protein NFIA_095140 [Aspergillus fischeri NRRL 181]KAG2009319.1 hypothetical protein GB937_007722 [Aspergillus fischeri]